MFTSILSKLGLPIFVLALGGIGGMFLQHKVFRDEPERIDYSQVRSIIAEEIARIPKPQPTVAVQPFEAESLKKIRGDFNYSPSYSGDIHVAGVDSAAVRVYIEQAVSNAFDKHIRKIKLKR